MHKFPLSFFSQLSSSPFKRSVRLSFGFSSSANSMFFKSIRPSFLSYRRIEGGSREKFSKLSDRHERWYNSSPQYEQ